MMKSKKAALQRSMENMVNLDDMEEPSSSFYFFIQKSSSAAIQRSIESLSGDLSEDDEGGSFHFGMDEPLEDAFPAPRKEVRFNDQVRCLKSKVSNKDMGSVWFTKQEISKMRKREMLLQTQMATRAASPTLDGDDDDDDDTKYVLVGQNSDKERRDRLQRIRDSRERVTEEQLSQEEKFFAENTSLESFQLNQEAISDCYFAFSRIATKVAIKRGRQVSNHVESLWEEEQDDNKSTDTLDVDSDLESDCSQDSCNRRLRMSHTKRRSSRQFALQSAGGNLIVRLAPAVA